MAGYSRRARRRHRPSLPWLPALSACALAPSFPAPPATQLREPVPISPTAYHNTRPPGLGRSRGVYARLRAPRMPVVMQAHVAGGCGAKTKGGYA